MSKCEKALQVAQKDLQLEADGLNLRAEMLVRQRLVLDAEQQKTVQERDALATTTAKPRHG